MKRACLTLLVLLSMAVVARAEDKPLHPPFPLLDAQGNDVLESSGPVSPTRTCTACHDADYIATHSYHADAGASARGLPTATPWAEGPGPFGGWDPLVYRRYSRKDGRRFDLGRAEWIRAAGRRHVGGGPTARTDDGRPLETLAPGDGALEVDTHVWDAARGAARRWDWQASGALELDCFVCHLRQPAFEARAAQLKSGRFRHAATATLTGTGLVEADGSGWRWNRARFDAEGKLDLTRLAESGHRLGVPEAANCGQCHGPTPGTAQPIRWEDLAGRKNLETRGQVFSAQRLRDSALNLRGKSELHRPFDVHAERLMVCSDCHFSPNNPAQESRSEASRPRHLRFDARRPATGEYLRRPNHNLARGRDGSMRSCADCHAGEDTHPWLPYAGTHLKALRCEACHVPHVHAPARRATDWTLLDTEGAPRIEYRGVEGSPDEAASLVTGFTPVLLPRDDPDGVQRLAPYNLIAFWYWLEESPQRPVRLVDLQAALLEAGDYHPVVKAVLDTDGDGFVAPAEARLDTPEKVEAVRRRLMEVGVVNPTIAAELRPFGIHHTVATGAFATRACGACHDPDSRIGADFDLASFAPGGVLPDWSGDARAHPSGSVETNANGALLFRPQTRGTGFYVLGHDHVSWIDALGLAAVALVMLGAGTHALLRALAARHRRSS